MDDLIDFLFDHPYLTTALLLNSYVFAFFPEFLAITAMATAAVFTIYSVVWIASSLIDWFTANELPPVEYVPAAEPPPVQNMQQQNNPYNNPQLGEANNVRRIHRNRAHRDVAVDSRNDAASAKYTGPLTLNGFEAAIDDATTSLISCNPFSDAVFAEDLFLQDKADLHQMLSYHRGLLEKQRKKIEANFDFKKAQETILGPHITSPCSSKEIDVERFLFSFVNFTEFCQTNIDINLLVKAATCPITNKIMDIPTVVHLKNRRNESFVLVCDKSALSNLDTRRFRLIEQTECIRLSGLLNAKHAQNGRNLRDILTTVHTELNSSNGASTLFHNKWEQAEAIAKRDFPPANISEPRFESDYRYH